MSDCEDLTTQLAKELVSGLKENVEELSSSFKKMAIIGNRAEMNETSKTVITVQEQPAPAQQVVEVPAKTPIPHIIQTKTNGDQSDTGQLSLFDLVA